MPEDRSTDAYKSLPHEDTRCGARWSGYATAHCASCHRTFTAVGNFDKHRTRAGCADPASLGMALSTRIYDAWSLPTEVKPTAWA